MPDADGSTGAPAVVCRLGDRLFAVSSSLVESMVQLPPVTRVPETPPYVRGVINLRGRILKVVDLRRRLGIPSLQDEAAEFTAMLDQRLEDHRDWLVELRTSVAQGLGFRGELDPNKCGFGRWYNRFETNDVVLRAMFERFDEPHKRLHAVGSIVNSLVQQGDLPAAQARVDEAEENELRTLDHLFRATKEAYLRSLREIAIVLGNDDNQTATVVDQVVAVEHLIAVDGDEEVANAVGVGNETLVSSIGRRQRNEHELVFTLCEHVVLEV